MANIWWESRNVLRAECDERELNRFAWRKVQRRAKVPMYGVRGVYRGANGTPYGRVSVMGCAVNVGMDKDVEWLGARVREVREKMQVAARLAIEFREMGGCDRWDDMGVVVVWGEDERCRVDVEV